MYIYVVIGASVTNKPNVVTGLRLHLRPVGGDVPKANYTSIRAITQGVGKVMRVEQKRDFVILGPVISAGQKVLETIHALYFLPENFTLVLAGGASADRSLSGQIHTLVERDEIEHRVRFAESNPNADVIVLPNTGNTRARNSVAGDSPEALASAILHASRKTY